MCFFLGASAQTFFGPQNEEIENSTGGFRVRGQPVIEMVADRILYQPLRLDCRKAVFGLAHEFRFTDKAGHQRTATEEYSDKYVAEKRQRERVEEHNRMHVRDLQESKKLLMGMRKEHEALLLHCGGGQQAVSPDSELTPEWKDQEERQQLEEGLRRLSERLVDSEEVRVSLLTSNQKMLSELELVQRQRDKWEKECLKLKHRLVDRADEHSRKQNYWSSQVKQLVRLLLNIQGPRAIKEMVEEYEEDI